MRSDDLKFRRRREVMVREQLEARGIRDSRVLSAMGTVPRHLFVSEALMDQAYGDHALPIGEQQTISQPLIVAEMTEAIQANAADRVLEIGTGSGFQAAILAEMVFRVYTIERIHTLYMRTRRLFDQMRYHNIVTRYSDGTAGWKDEAPFDAIIVTAGGPRVPRVLLEQLADGGRLVMPVGDTERQELVRVVRSGSSYTQERLGSCRFVKLVGEHGWRE